MQLSTEIRRGLQILSLELQTIVSPLQWVLGIKLGFSARTVDTLDN